jgi:hypothetical protein
MYSRNVIRLGKYSFRPNVGVAQGSVISPYLFDIFIEDLFKEIVLNKKLVPMQNVLAYADDVLVVCSGLGKLKDIIQTVEQWSNVNGMLLNRKKSAVVEFLPRYARSDVYRGQLIMGIPVETKYKYLGVWLNQKLNLDPQLVHIKRKSDFIRASLGPVLSKCSLGYRKNLWDLFVRPLFEFTLPIHTFEPAATRKDKLRRLVKYTFKSFCRISKTAPDVLIHRLCGYDVDNRGKTLCQEQRAKWQRRSEKWSRIYKEKINILDIFSMSEVYQEEVLLETENGGISPCKEIPAVGVEYINLMTKLCPWCPAKSIMNARHLRETHNKEFPEPLILFEQVRKEQSLIKGTRVARLLLGHKRIKKRVDLLNKFLVEASGNNNGV